jgi:hypothetical protein
MAIFDPKAIDPVSGKPLGDPSVNAAAIQAAQEQGIGIPQDPRQQDARQKAILRNIEQQKLDKAAERKNRQAAIRNQELVSQINAALASGAFVSEKVLKQANVPAATIADVQRHQTALQTLKGTPGVQQGNRYDLTKALQSGVSIETLANAGFNPDDIDRAQSASRNGQRPVEAASSFSNLASFPTHAPIGTGRTGGSTTRRAPPRKQRKVATANQPPKTNAAQRRYSDALEQVQPYVISSRRPQDSAASTLIDVSKALAAGVSHKLLRDLGIPQRTITEAEARQQPNVPARRRGASVQVTLRDFDIQAERSTGARATTAGVPTPSQRQRPVPGKKLSIPKDIKADLKDMRRSSRLLGSSFRGAALPVVIHQGAQLALASTVKKGIETGDLTPTEARASIKEFTATPITSGNPTDLLYIVPGIGTFMSYKDMQRSGGDPLKVAFFVVSVAADALILFIPARAGVMRIATVPIAAATKVTPKVIQLAAKVSPTRAPKTGPGSRKRPSSPTPSKAATKRVQAIESTPQLGDQPVTLPSGKTVQVRKPRGTLGESDTTPLSKLTADVGSERVGIIIEAAKPPPYPIWGESPMGSMPLRGAGPKGGGFVWTVERYDAYIQSLKNGGSSPEAIARVERLRDLAEIKGRAGGGTALLEEYQTSHPMPTPQSSWERPQPSLAKSNDALLVALAVNARGNRQLKALAAETPRPTTMPQWLKASEAAVDTVLRSELAIATLTAAIEAPATGTDAKATTVGQTSPASLMALLSATEAARLSELATKATTAGLTATETTRLTSLLTKAELVTPTVPKVSTVTQPATGIRTTTLTRPTTGLQVGTRAVTGTQKSPKVSGKPSTVAAQKAAVQPATDSPQGRPVPAATKTATTTSTKTTSTAIGGTPPRPKLLPRFTLPNGKQLKAGEYPDTVDWKQGFTGITYTLSTSKTRYRKVKKSGEPEKTFRVLTMHKDAPEPRIVPLGAFNVVVKRKGLTFVRTKRKTLDKSKPKNQELKKIDGLTPSATDAPTVDEVFAGMATLSRRQEVGSSQYVTRRGIVG